MIYFHQNNEFTSEWSIFNYLIYLNDIAPFSPLWLIFMTMIDVHLKGNYFTLEDLHFLGEFSSNKKAFITLIHFHHCNEFLCFTNIVLQFLFRCQIQANLCPSPAGRSYDQMIWDGQLGPSVAIVWAISSKVDFLVGGVVVFWPNILSILVLIEIMIRIKTRLWQFFVICLLTGIFLGRVND